MPPKHFQAASLAAPVDESQDISIASVALRGRSLHDLSWLDAGRNQPVFANSFIDQG